MTTEALAGRRIVVTRASTQARPLRDAIVDLGGEVISLPLLEIRDAADGGTALLAHLGSLTANDWLVALSPNGARRIVEHIEPNTCRLAAVASGTAAVFEKAGWTVNLLPDNPSSQGLLDAFDDLVVDGRVLVAQAEGGRTNLVDGLRERGVAADSVIAYRNIAPVVDDEAVQAARGGDTVVFASPSAVVRYVELVGTTPVDSVCIGSVTAASARGAGFHVTAASAPTVEALITALCLKSA
ncbi:MAG: uroporphyrinogen-III synthase [Acidimicrobiia bacterium]|nr:uroporphyrinogen-III synthase [Acidimicrobiia bacterium]